MAEPTERVQAVKYESAATGGDDADNDPFAAYSVLDETEDMLSSTGLVVQPLNGTADEDVKVWREGDSLMFKDLEKTGGLSLSDLAATAGGGITAADHKTLRQLIHFINDGPAEGFATGAYREITGGVFPTDISWYTATDKVDKLIDLTLTYSGINITGERWRMYDADGSTVIATVSDSVSYSGVFETNRTRTIS